MSVVACAVNARRSAAGLLIVNSNGRRGVPRAAAPGQAVDIDLALGPSSAALTPAENGRTDQPHWAQAFFADAGASWETNRAMDFTRSA